MGPRGRGGELVKIILEGCAYRFGHPIFEKVRNRCAYGQTRGDPTRCDPKGGPDSPPKVFVRVNDVRNVQVPKGIGVEVFGFLEINLVHPGDVRPRSLP